MPHQAVSEDWTLLSASWPVKRGANPKTFAETRTSYRLMVVAEPVRHAGNGSIVADGEVELVSVDRLNLALLQRISNPDRTVAKRRAPVARQSSPSPSGSERFPAVAVSPSETVSA